MKGRKPLPTHLKLLRGNPGRHPLKHGEPQPEQSIDVPDPPAFVTGYAADEWWVVAVELHRLGVLSKIDLAPLASYCMAYAHWRTAEEALARMAANDRVMSGLIIKGKYGDAVQNPLVSIARKAAGDMVRYAAEFGLTPAARSRIAAGTNGDDRPGKFAGLLAG
jgi:P27 family predicted phage terminase small subunit